MKKVIKMKRSILLIIASIVSICTFSQPNEKLLRKAEKGNAKAQYELARYYRYYESDTIQAIKWYKKAAEHDYKDACRRLAMLYHSMKDYKEAAVWCEKSGGGLPWEILAGYYKRGEGVEQNFEKAAYWYEKAIESCRPIKKKDFWSFIVQSDMFSLAECYDSLAKYTDALKWYEEVLNVKIAPYEQRDDAAEWKALAGMIRLYHLGLGVQKDQNRVNGLLSLLSRRVGSNWLASYAIEIAIDRDDDMSLFWTEVAVKYGSELGKYWMGRIYENGKYGVKKSDEKAFEWYKKAVDDKYIDAYYRLGLMYEQGRGVAKDVKYAFDLYKIVVDYCQNQKDKKYLLSDAMGRMGIMYYYGYHVVVDYNMAFLYLLSAAYSFHDPEVMSTLASCYRYGKGTALNQKEAEYWFNMAVKYGDETAIWLSELAQKRGELNIGK